MKRTTFVGITGAAISVLVLLLLISSCSTPNGSGTGPTTPTPWNTPTQVSAPQPNSNGSMVRANVHGTGVFVTKGVRQLTGVKWKFKTVSYGVNTTPVTNGTVVSFGGRDGRLYAVDAEIGPEKWNRKLDNQFTSAQAIAGDTIYVGAWNELYALSTDTGYVKCIMYPRIRARS